MYNQKNVKQEFVIVLPYLFLQPLLLQVFPIDLLNSLYHSAPVEEQTLKVDCLPRK